MQLTAVDPTANTEPDGGVQVTAPHAGEPGANVTTVPHELPEDVSAEISEQLMMHEGDPTVTQPENSDVLLDGSVAVAVITLPIGTDTARFTLIFATQPAGGVLTFAAPIKVSP